MTKGNLKTQVLIISLLMGLVGCNKDNPSTSISDEPSSASQETPSSSSVESSPDVSSPDISSTDTQSDESSSPVEEVFTANFLVDGEIFYTVSGTEGQRITSPRNKPEKEHKTFTGWDGFTNGSRFTENVEYNAIFEDTIYTVTFKVGSETYKEYKGIYGSTFAKPDNPTISGGTFLGWNDFNEETDLTITKNVIYNANYKYSGFPYITGNVDMASLEKDEIFNEASAIESFSLTLHTTPGDVVDNQRYSASVIYDDSYLYVFIESVDSTKTDSDRLAFYVGKADGGFAVVDFRPNKAEAYKNDANAIAISGINTAGNYVLKAKLSLDNLKIENNKVFMSFRFINNASEKFDYYASIGSTTKDDGSGKIESTSGLVGYDLESKE